MEFQSINLFKWDYLVVDCGYVSRLHKHIASIRSQTTVHEDDVEEDHALMFFIDYTYNSLEHTSKYKIMPVELDKDHVYEALVELIDQQKLSDVKAVCFKYVETDIDYVKLLQEYEHCACFGEPYIVASFKTKSGKTVLYKKFDTESG